MRGSGSYGASKERKNVKRSVLGGTIDVVNTSFGLMIRAIRDDGEMRTTFCENRQEYEFEYPRTEKWLIHELEEHMFDGTHES